MRATKHSANWGDPKLWAISKTSYYSEQTEALLRSTFPALFNPQRGKLRSRLEAAADLMDLIDYCDAIKLIALKITSSNATFTYTTETAAQQQTWCKCYREGHNVIFTGTPSTHNYDYLKQRFYPRSTCNFDRFLRKGFEIEATRRKLVKFTKAIESELEGSLDLLILLTTT